MSTVLVAGLGYVGLPVTVRAVEAGHRVVGLDVDRARVAALRAGSSPVEDVPDARLRRALDSGRLRLDVAVEDPAGGGAPDDAEHRFDVALITVPTPLTGGEPDLGAVRSAARVVARSLTPGASVVLESTTYPGTTEEVVGPLLGAGSGLVPGRDFHLGYSPERIAPADPDWSFENTPKLVSATTRAGLERVRAFYDTLVERTVPVAAPRTAELAKLVENVFSQVNIALVNELATLCHPLGLDVWEVLDAVETKPHGFLRHDPGPGVGGHCIPVDPGYLSWLVRTRLGARLRLSDLAQEVNDAMPRHVADRVEELLAPRGLRGAAVLLLGVAYKADTGDVRETPALPLVRELRARGADVRAVDPLARGWTETPLVDPADLDDEVATAAVVVLLAAHRALDLDKVRANAQRLLDCRNKVAPGPGVWRL